jgi:hypothetical protein
MLTLCAEALKIVGPEFSGSMREIRCDVKVSFVLGLLRRGHELFRIVGSTAGTKARKNEE